MADVPTAVDEVDLDPREESNDVPMAVDEVDVDHREELNELKVVLRQLELVEAVEELAVEAAITKDIEKCTGWARQAAKIEKIERQAILREDAEEAREALSRRSEASVGAVEDVRER
ncbi:hypothetical protein COOONC_20195 [Cooperia oncophora]